MTRHTYPAPFEAFWSAYPRAEAKAHAFQCWQRAVIDGHDPERIVYMAERFAAYMAHDGRPHDKIPHPATFLNQRLDDDPERWPGAQVATALRDAEKRRAMEAEALADERRTEREKAEREIKRVADVPDGLLAKLVEEVLADLSLARWERAHLSKTKAHARKSPSWRLRLIERLDEIEREGPFRLTGT